MTTLDERLALVDAADEQAAREKGFWHARPVLTHLHTFARARRVAPWAVLGAVLARVVTATPTKAQLPPTIGSYASLNLFVGLVGPSGSGKDAARRVAADAVDLGDAEAWTVPIGSGEGLSHMFMRRPKKDEGEDPIQYRHAALVTIGEIDTLGALIKRQSSTVASQLRQAAMGEQLGFFYVDTDKRMIVPEHAYRLCLLAGVQPRRSAVLLDDADGGTPQRFVWMPATDADAPLDAPEEPRSWDWTAPDWSTAPTPRAGGQWRTQVRLPRTAVDTVVQAHYARLRGEGNALDGHALLTRLKVAAALAILDGRTYVGDEDWSLAGYVMEISDATRARCQAALVAEKRERNTEQAHAEAERTVVVQERVEQAKMTKVCDLIKRHLRLNDGTLKGGELRRKLGSNGSHLDAAAELLTTSGDITITDTEYRGQKGKVYALR